MFELKFSGEGLFLVASIVAVILFAGVYLFWVWATKKEQRRTMERISGESWRSFGEWSSQTVSEIEDSYDRGLPLPREYPTMPRVSQPRAELDDDDPTLDMNLR